MSGFTQFDEQFSGMIWTWPRLGGGTPCKKSVLYVLAGVRVVFYAMSCDEGDVIFLNLLNLCSASDDTQALHQRGSDDRFKM